MTLLIHDYALEWAKYHIDTSKTDAVRKLHLKNYTFIKKFGSSLNKYNDQRIFYTKHTNNLHVKNSLVFDTGLPIFEHFLLTPCAYYITNFKLFDLWKHYDIDSDILRYFKSLKNTKYEQYHESSYLPNNYILYAMQALHDDWLLHIKTMLVYAKKYKKLIVFKPHPIQTDSYKIWQSLSSLHSDYSLYISDVSIIDLIKNSNKVVASDSSTTLIASLYGIPSATFKSHRFSTIIPIITSMDYLDRIDNVKYSDLKRFLTWYYYKLVVDVSKDTYEEKIDKIVTYYFKYNKSFEYIFSNESDL